MKVDYIYSHTQVVEHIPQTERLAGEYKGCTPATVVNLENGGNSKASRSVQTTQSNFDLANGRDARVLVVFSVVCKRRRAKITIGSDKAQ